MAVEKRLHKFSTIEALNLEVASAWTEYTRQKIRKTGGETGSANQAEFALEDNHTIVYLYGEHNFRLLFTANAADNITGLSTGGHIELEKEVMHKLFIPNGATRIHAASSETGNVDKYIYLTTG